MEKCHQNVPTLNAVKPLSLRESLKTIGYKLWDENQQRLVSFREARRENRVWGDE